MIRLLRDLEQRGVRLRLQGEEIAFTAPRGALTPALLRELRAHQADLRDYLLMESAPGGLTMDPERLLAEAAEQEGSSDLGPEAPLLREAMAVYAESVERDVQPHGLGRIYLRERMFRLSLRARLRLAPWLAPGARPRQAPLVVCGLPRSGTTLLHRLLALADDAAGLPLWQLLEPLPPPRGPDLRREHVVRNLTWLNGLVPVPLDAQHYVRPDLADECGHLLRTCFLGSMPWQAPAYGWLEWSLRQDTGPAYRVWAAFLARLEPEGKRLVLKDPFHAAHLAELAAACPGAMVAQLHRDPVESVPSFHKLCTTMHAVLVNRLDLPRTVEAHLRWLEWVVERNAAGRSAAAGRLVDVDYRALMADPAGQVARIHQAFGLPLTSGHQERMREFLAENPRRKHGENPHAPADFGQTAEAIAERFQDYRRRHGFS